TKWLMRNAAMETPSMTGITSKTRRKMNGTIKIPLQGYRRDTAGPGVHLALHGVHVTEPGAGPRDVRPRVRLEEPASSPSRHRSTRCTHLHGTSRCEATC